MTELPQQADLVKKLNKHKMIKEQQPLYNTIKVRFIVFNKKQTKSQKE